MAIRQTKKISELNTLTSASLNTYVLGVDNGSTYKITLDVLEDAVVNMVSRSTDLRLDALENYTSSANVASDLSSLNQFTSSQTTLNSAFTNGINGRLQTSSFNTFSASVHSEILAATNEQSLTNLVTTSSFNQYTQSISTGSLINRLNQIENVTSSYETKGTGILSGSISYTSLTNIPQGIVSQSTDLTSLNNFTASISTESLVNRLNAIENISGSWITENETGSFLTSLNGAISSSSQLTSSYDIRYVLSGSITQTNWDNISGKPSGLVSQSTDLSSLNQFTSSYNSDSSSFDSRITSLVTSGVPAGTVSGSSQLTASYDTRYTISGSVQPLPSGIISGSSQLTSSLDLRYAPSASYLTSLNGAFSSSAQLPIGIVSGSSQLTASYDTRYALSASYLTSLNGAFSSSIQTLGGSGVWSGSAQLPVGVISGSSQLTTSLAQLNSDNSFVGNQQITGSLNITNGIFANSLTVTTFYAVSSSVASTSGSTSFGSVNGDFMNVTGSIYATNAISAAAFIGLGNLQSYSSSVESKIIADRMRLTTLESVTSSYETKGRGIISGSSQLTSSYDSRYVISGSITQTTWDNIANKPSGIISGSSQLTSSFETIGRGIISSSAQLPSGLISGSSQLPVGIISGSSQLTASYDIRYALSGSGGSATIPAGTVSGSSQLTSSYDGRYTLTSSFNSFTASAQAVTTGSNSFNGTQTITGSLIVTTGSFVGSTITANTSSLYLTSGSNMYVQNNGVVEITGSLIVSGSTNFKNNITIGTGSGAEGGQIDLAYAQSGNTTLTGSSVSIDVFGDKVRIFENAGNNRGVSIDLSKTPASVGADLLWKTSGLINTGSFVQLDNIKAGPTRTGAGGGYAGLSIGAVSTSFVADVSAVYSNTTVGGQTITGTTYTTTAANSWNGWGFLQGQQSTYIVNDTTNSRVYRITLMIGASYNNNFVSIERLH